MTWVKGISGNPKGPPKLGAMLARLARNRTHDGLDLIEFALSVLHGKVEEHASTRDRLEAMKWLADRGWGKAVEHVEISDEGATVRTQTIATEVLEAGLAPRDMIQ